MNLTRMTSAIAKYRYYAGIALFTKKPVNSAKGLRDRKMQRAMMQFFKPENDFEIREALLQAKQTDLMGSCECLIPSNPPIEAVESRRRLAGGDHYHTIANRPRARSRVNVGPGR